MNTLLQRNAQIELNLSSFIKTLSQGIKNLGLNLVGSKKEISQKIANDVEAFLSNGGEITYC